MTNGENSLLDSTTQAADQPAEGSQDTGTMFIGEGKQYSSVEEADKAIAFKEDHIKRLEAENAKYREEVAKAHTIDEVLQSIKQTGEQVLESNSATTEGNHQVADLDAKIAEVLDQRLTAERQAQIAGANSAQVAEALTSKYGDKAGDVYKRRGEELGIDLDQLAATSPQAVIELFGATEAPVTSAAPASTVNSSAIGANSSSEYGTKAYWDKQYSEGKLTLEKKLQKEHESLNAMGPDKFYNN